MYIEMKEEYGQVHLEDLGLSNRAFNMLKRAGVNTLTDLIMREEVGLSDVRGLGIQTINEVENILHNLDGLEIHHDEVKKTVELSKSVLNHPISDLRASIRVLNALASGGVRTVGDVLELKPDEIMHLCNLGSKSYRELTI